MEAFSIKLPIPPDFDERAFNTQLYFSTLALAPSIRLPPLRAVVAIARPRATCSVREAPGQDSHDIVPRMFRYLFAANCCQR